MPTRLHQLITCLILFLLPLTAEADEHTFLPFPKAADTYWRTAIPEAMRTDYISLGEQYQGKAWQTIPNEVFAEFRANGNRTHYESLSFAVRKQLACLVIAEIMDHRGRFLPDICRGLHYFREQEPWWGIPAHYPTSQPKAETQVVDLFNAETAAMLAWTIYMLAPEIDSHEPGLSDTIRQEITRRFLHPTLHEKQGWKRNANNWNTWITSNWIACTLICEQDTAERNAALKDAAACLQLFIDHYPKDGGCEEGVAYWDRAAGSYFEGMWWMIKPHPLTPLQGEGSKMFPDPKTSQQATQANHSPLLGEGLGVRLLSLGSFLPTMHIRDLQFVNFSDATPFCLPNINILFPFGASLGNADMMQLAAYIAQRYDYYRHPSRLFLASGNYPTLGRELLLLSMLPQLQATAPRQPSATDAWLENSQIMVAGNDSWFLAAKGGHNGESHNHNDVGTFILYHKGQPVVIDLGRDTYTLQTFSARRYEMMNNRSAYHNVPLINRQEQAAGKQYKAKDVRHESTPALSSLTMNLAQAYPDSAAIQSWTQTLTLDRKHNTVSLSALFTNGQQASHFTPLSLREGPGVRLSLMCYGQPILTKKGQITLQDGAVTITYDTKQLTPKIEKVDMPKGIMREQWHNNVYRLTLTLTKKALRKGEVGIRFTD